MKKHALIVLIAIMFSVLSLYAAQIPVKGYVNADIGLNVRVGPSESTTRIGGLDDRTNVIIDSVSGNWYHITSPCVGYVCGDYVIVTEYGEAPDGEDSNNLDVSKMTPEEIDRVGCDINKSLSATKITKAPAQNSK